MGGRMDMMNVEGGGPALAIELPVDAAPPEPAPEVGAPQTSRSLSVIVVEDEDSVRRGIARMAERLGHRTTTVAAFAAAVTELQNAAEPYDALIVDVHLDEAHTGFDLFEALRLGGRGPRHRLGVTTGDSISPKTRHPLPRSQRPRLSKTVS